VTGVDTPAQVHVGLVFGVFEAGRPVLGLVIWHNLASILGHATDGSAPAC
jgi:hypothetical protein